MSEEIEIAGIKAPKTDWEATPASIQTLVVVLNERLSKLNKNFRNSPNPPSADGSSMDRFSKPAKGQETTLERLPDQSIKSPPQARKPYPVEACKEVYEGILAG